VDDEMTIPTKFLISEKIGNTSPLLLRKHSNSELISLLLLDVECTEKKQEAPMLVFGENKTQKFSGFFWEE
jgi:hypothetical protein